MQDYGYVQGTSTEQLKAYVFTEPIVVAAPVSKGKSDSKTTPSTAVDKPITMKQKKGEKKNEIFVDIYERLNLTFNANGYVLNSSIDGTIQMKSYLAGNPELKLALNEDLVIGKAQGGGGGVEIDDCNFHECVKLQDWDSLRILSFLPPDGEFTLMNYRVTSEFQAPFKIFPFFELVSAYKVELIIKVRAEIPENSKGTSVVCSVPVPKGCSGATCNLVPGVVGQVWEYDAAARVILWKIKAFPGGREESIKCNIALGSAHTASVRKEIGPISLAFEIPMFNPSGLQVRYLRINAATQSYQPYRWVRFVTRSQSYVCRL
jgi:AP-4 complex subunit mu-1